MLLSVSKLVTKFGNLAPCILVLTVLELSDTELQTRTNVSLGRDGGFCVTESL